ncbi:MAG: hypothetical protein ACP5HS_01095 [Anaerolineae bacterium]
MRWYRDLTAIQRLILLALALSVVAVVGLLVWSIRSSGLTDPERSPVATPFGSADSPLSTPSPQPSATSDLAPTPSPRPTVAFDISRAGIIASEVAEVRETRNRWGTPLTLVDDLGMAQAIYARHESWPPLAMRMETVLRAMHLWFWDPLRLDIVAQAKGTAAYYTPELEELYLRRDWTDSITTLETQLAYGYARALPDQYGNLTDLIHEAASLDRQLALTAVAEGDALLALWLYMGVAPGSVAAQEIQETVADANCPKWQVGDPLLLNLSCLSLELGADFTRARYEDGGIGALDEAILRPPRSTEQLLHPERYADDPDEPRVLSPLEPSLERGFVLTATETVGEALMGVIFEEWSNGMATPDAVAGWDGDLLQIWENAEGETVAVWQTVWDEATTAREFYTQLSDLMPDPLVSGFIRDRTAPSDLPWGKWWAGRQGTVFIYRWTDQVWLVWGDDAATVETVGAALPRASAPSPVAPMD